MKILIESGSTKSEWRILGEGKQYILPGMNVSSMSLDYVKGVLADGLSRCGDTSLLEAVFIYTAGVVTQAIRDELSAFIRTYARTAVVDVQDDLVGACRAAWGNGSGLVAILGTGSNTGFTDGTCITQNVHSGGYVIGDHGSACVLGKLFLEDWIKYEVPKDVAADFSSKFDGSYETIVKNIYKGEAPSRYLGSFAPFIVSHYESSQYIRDLVDGNFRQFAKKSLMAYDVSRYPVVVIGSFGWACKEIVARIFAEYGIRISRFMPAPIEGLAEYHSSLSQL